MKPATKRLVMVVHLLRSAQLLQLAGMQDRDPLAER